MKGFCNAKVILLQTSPPKHQSGGAGVAAAGGSAVSIASLVAAGSHHRLWLTAFACFFTFASLIVVLTTTTTTARDSSPPPIIAATAVEVQRITPSPRLPAQVFDTLLHYAASHGGGAAAGGMSDADLRAVAAVLRRRAPCNLLVFGLGPETPLWHALNHGGRTVFVDENEYYAAHLEERHPGLEAYGVSYASTRVADLAELLSAARAERTGDCRPVQNLLYSDCRLGINDLPNGLYDVRWDVILVDGPRGHEPEAPGRMSTIFTAAVMARSSPARGGAGTDVLVHDYKREVERACGEEFLCVENMVGAAAGELAHFVVRGGGAGEFCGNRTAAAAAPVDVAVNS